MYPMLAVDEGMKWLAGLLLGLAVGWQGIILKRMSRDTDKATIRKLNVESNAAEVAALRDVLAEIRIERAEDKTEIVNLKERVDKLEERERHSLARQIVHEAWDTIAYSTLLRDNPDHPPPPPLAFGILTAREDKE